MKNKAVIAEKEAAAAEEPNPKGIPEFWFTIFRNVDMLSELVQVGTRPTPTYRQASSLWTLSRRWRGWKGLFDGHSLEEESGRAPGTLLPGREGLPRGTSGKLEVAFAVCCSLAPVREWIGSRAFPASHDVGTREVWGRGARVEVLVLRGPMYAHVWTHVSAQWPQACASLVFSLGWFLKFEMGLSCSLANCINI